VDSFTTGLAKEVGRHGVRVNAVRPGMTVTDMTSDTANDLAAAAGIAATIPMNRMASASEIARPAVWLLGEDASFVSGALLDVSGGGFIVGKPFEQP
jgi:NAD(P)-dependent dehydrogenase (short-subunit alcohol dehydrogenase family)